MVLLIIVNVTCVLFINIEHVLFVGKSLPLHLNLNFAKELVRAAKCSWPVPRERALVSGYSHHLENDIL